MDRLHHFTSNVIIRRRPFFSSFRFYSNGDACMYSTHTMHTQNQFFVQFFTSFHLDTSDILFSCFLHHFKNHLLLFSSVPWAIYRVRETFVVRCVAINGHNIKHINALCEKMFGLLVRWTSPNKQTNKKNKNTNFTIIFILAPILSSS